MGPLPEGGGVLLSIISNHTKIMLVQTARYVPKPAPHPHKLILFDVMDTLIADPFFRGFEKDLFGLEGGISSLFAIKDQKSFIAFEKGEITEEQHFATYFTDRRECDGDAVVNYMHKRYAWLPGMKELCTELRDAGVEMAACSNCASHMPWHSMELHTTFCLLSSNAHAILSFCSLVR